MSLTDRQASLFPQLIAAVGLAFLFAVVHFTLALLGAILEILFRILEEVFGQLMGGFLGEMIGWEEGGAIMDQIGIELFFSLTPPVIAGLITLLVAAMMYDRYRTGMRFSFLLIAAWLVYVTVPQTEKPFQLISPALEGNMQAVWMTYLIMGVCAWLLDWRAGRKADRSKLYNPKQDPVLHKDEGRPD